MALKKINFKSYEQLTEHIKSHTPTFYYSSQTSTVIPYDKLEEIYKDKDFCLGDLSHLPSNLVLRENGDLEVHGPVSWKEAREFLRPKGKNIKTAPTEELALITAGAATSATGERCFHFGNLRSQIKEITYIDYQGKEKTLSVNNKFQLNSTHLSEYDKSFKNYQEMKNAPFPRLETETDLMIGTEGQLGVITNLVIETTDDLSVQHLFMLLPKWEENLAPHLEVIKKIQSFREEVILCEFIDSNSFSYLPKEERPNQEMDAIFFEVKMDQFEKFYSDFLMDLSFLDENLVFELTETKFHVIRASVPRAVFEKNSQMGVVKMGTDVQVHLDKFEELMNIYKKFTQVGVNYNLFGHFGDAHLHFNFMPSKHQTDVCQKELEYLYQEVVKLGGSPFAEHGIGVIKQKYIRPFWTSAQYNVFKDLKKEHDPHNQFFPPGFMNLTNE